MNRILIFMAGMIVLVFATFEGRSQSTGKSYKLLKKIELGGEGSWDYLTLDSESRRLYITRGSHVMVMDVDKNKLIGDIPDTPGVHGVALAPKWNRGFTSNGGDSTVSVFDLKTLKETARIKVGSKPDAILYDPATDRVLTFNAGSEDATAIMAETAKVAGTIKLGGRPEFGVADGKGMIYVNILGKNDLVAFDAKELTIKNRWPLAPGETPTGLAMDYDKRRLFSTCRNGKMIVLEADTGKILSTLPIGDGTDACIFDAKSRLAFSSNRDGTLTIVEETDGKFQVQANVRTQFGAKTMAFDAKTQNLFLVTADFKEPADGKKAVPVPKTFSVLVIGK